MNFLYYWQRLAAQIKTIGSDPPEPPPPIPGVTAPLKPPPKPISESARIDAMTRQLRRLQWENACLLESLAAKLVEEAAATTHNS